MMEKTRFENDLTQGSVARQLLKFAVPFIVSNLIQSLYSVADMIIVGKLSGSESMNGVTQGSQITMLITNAIVGLSVGGTVLIGQYLGANRREDVKKTIGTLLSTLISLSIVVTMGALLLRNPILSAMRVPSGEVFSEAFHYFTVTAWGTFFIFGYNALSAIMRGMGDSKTPLTFVGIAAVLNIGLDLLMVGPMGMKANGAAIATVISQAVSMILCVIYLKTHDFIFRFDRESFRFDRHKLRLLFKIGFPTMLNNIGTGLSFVFILSLANTLGNVAGSAVGAVGRINSFAILPVIAISSAVSAMAAQNIGAGKTDRASLTMRTGIAMAMVISLIIFTLVQFFPDFFLGLFLSKDDVHYFQYIDDGRAYIRTLSIDYLLVPFQFCLNGLFIGAGYTNFSLLNGLTASLLVRIPASYLLGILSGFGLSGLGLGAPSATSIAIIFSVIFFFSGKWKKRRILGINQD